MGLFPSSKDFKDGPGVEKDTPRKTGVGRFFELVGRDMSSMFLANLLTCIGFAPVICLVYIGFLQNSLPVMLGSAAVGGLLAGPALAGMYDTVLRALRDEAGYWWVTYRKAFKRNFKASLVPGVLYTVVVTLQIFLVYFCFNMLYHGTNVGVPLWVATVLNLVLFQMLFAYMWPQVVLLDQPLSLTLKYSSNCMIAFLPHALAAAIVQVLFWGVVILCMPLGLFLMLIFGFWFVTEVSCQIVYGDIDRVFHIEENIRKLKDSNGQYLWQLALHEGGFDTLLGKRIYTSPYAPELAAGQKTVAFGDFNYYWIGDRLGITFKRLNERFAETGQIGFIASKRLDGKLILPEAIKVLQQKGTASSGT